MEARSLRCPTLESHRCYESLKKIMGIIRVVGAEDHSDVEAEAGTL